MMKWIDKIPLPILLGITIFMAILPVQGESHLLEKLTMLQQGVLSKPIDIFDLFMHGTPALLLLVRVFRQFVMGIKLEPRDD